MPEGENSQNPAIKSENPPGQGDRQTVFRSQDVSRNPGVYVFRNNLGEVIYVGKARNLRNRMRSYFMPSTAMRSDPRRRALIHSIASYETFEVASETEAFLLEAQFIKQYNPRYNVEMRDDKRYLVVCVDLSVNYPRFEFCRLKRDDQRLYFGPYPQAYALRDTIRFLEVRFGLRSCSVAEPDEECRKHCLEHVLRDCSSPCIGAISCEEYRERLNKALEILKGEEPARQLIVELNEKMLECSRNMQFEEAAHYRDILDHLKLVVEPARRFANQTMATRHQRTHADLAAVQALQEALSLAAPPQYVECFDMSHISGSLAVGSMVCFRNGRPSSSDYRRFRIKNQEAADDTAFMREVLARRYGRLQRENLPMPDLIVLDGGASQVAVGQEVLASLDLLQIPMIGLAKRDELVVLPGGATPIALPFGHPGLKMLQAIRDEAHRFANGYHRELRNKRISNSILDDIPGIGETRKTALLKHFGSVQAIRDKTPKELAAGIPELGIKTATAILDYLSNH